MSLSFISDENFRKHIRETIEHYGDNLRSYNLRKFNSNIVDPIKLLFGWDIIFRKASGIRRVSIDKFYELVTGEEDAFCKMCMALPAAIKNLLEEVDELKMPCDTVFEELKNSSASSMGLALFMLGFETYSGFKR